MRNLILGLTVFFAAGRRFALLGGAISIFRFATSGLGLATETVDV